MEMNFSETAEDNLAMAGEHEELAEMMREEAKRLHAMAREGAEELEEARLEAEERRHNGFFARE